MWIELCNSVYNNNWNITTYEQDNLSHSFKTARKYWKAYNIIRPSYTVVATYFKYLHVSLV